MTINKLKKEQQAKGEFNGGEILENKPIGFPQDGGQEPYSNLFYWAHAYTDKGSLIGEHPHKGFEIMSIVVEGEIEHFDNKNNKWIPLKKGDVQIIRAGSGITHAEQMKAGSQMFQIWFDPDLTKTLDKDPSYNDYAEAKFPVDELDGVRRKTIAGEGSPLEMESPGISIFEIDADAGEHRISTGRDKTGSLYLISGRISIGDTNLEPDDFAMIHDAEEVKVEVAEKCRYLLITSPVSLDYKPYLQLFNR